MISVSSTNTALEAQSKQVMKVYTAKAYTKKEPRLTNEVEINAPEYVPTVPKDDKKESIAMTPNYFENTNYPITTRVATLSHSMKLPLLRGTTCPIYMKKGTPLFLYMPTAKIEEGYLLYV